MRGVLDEELRFSNQFIGERLSNIARIAWLSCESTSSAIVGRKLMRASEDRARSRDRLELASDTSYR
jgi:hypothetical protein